MDIDLESLSKAELQSLIRKAEKALRTLDERRKAEARRAAETAAKEYGFSLDELLGNTSVRRSKGVAKYRNPHNPDMTWTGKGRKPNWVIAALEDGLSLDDMKI